MIPYEQVLNLLLYRKLQIFMGIGKRRLYRPLPQTGRVIKKHSCEQPAGDKSASYWDLWSFSGKIP